MVIASAAVRVIVGGVLLRTLLFACNLQGVLQERVEVATPVTSFLRLREGLFSLAHGSDPYDAHILHQPPLLLHVFRAAFAVLPGALAAPVVFIGMDVVGAIAAYALGCAFVRLSMRGVLGSPSPAAHPHRVGTWLAAAYMLSPMSVATCVGCSLVVFNTVSVLVSLACVLHGRWVCAAVAAAFAVHLSLYPLMLISPLCLLGVCVSGVRWPVFAGVFVAALMAILGVSGVFHGGWGWVEAVYGTQLLLPDYTPNVGLFWYFFMEIFEHFRPFFVFVFQYHAFIYVVPLTMRVYHAPVFLAIVLLALMAIFKAYPQIGDLVPWMTLLPLCAPHFPRMRYLFLMVNLGVFVCVLAPIFWHLWIWAGSGNANFFYNASLLYGLINIWFVLDLLYSRFLWDAEQKHPVPTSSEKTSYTPIPN